jgi:hypothetical protein
MPSDRVLDVGESHDRSNRPEDLVVHQVGLGRNVVEYRRGVVVAVTVRNIARRSRRLLRG